MKRHLFLSSILTIALSQTAFATAQNTSTDNAAPAPSTAANILPAPTVKSAIEEKEIVPAIIDETIIGRVISSVGDFEILSDGKLSSNLDTPFSIRLNDVIKTKENSKLIILLNDESLITLGNSAEIALSQFQYDPSGKNDIQLSLIVNEAPMIIHSGHIKPGRRSQYKIETPHANILLRDGSLWLGQLGFYDVYVPEGESHIINKRGTTILKSGYGVSLNDPNSNLGSRSKWADSHIADAMERVQIEDVNYQDNLKKEIDALRAARGAEKIDNLPSLTAKPPNQIPNSFGTPPHEPPTKTKAMEKEPAIVAIPGLAPEDGAENHEIKLNAPSAAKALADENSESIPVIEQIEDVLIEAPDSIPQGKLE
jgi:hypothetical protein